MSPIVTLDKLILLFLIATINFVNSSIKDLLLTLNRLSIS